MEKKFNCKMEDLPVVAGFIFSSFENDKADFLSYSTVFADPFITNARAKQAECYEIVKSSDVIKHQKTIKIQIDNKMANLRLNLNQIEGYLKFAEKTLDIQIADFGLKAIRTAISNENAEKIISDGHTLLANLKRNETALSAQGMNNNQVIQLTTLISEIDELNTKHNLKKNERSRAADESIKIFNELWDITGLILNAGRAMYKGSNEVKIREYTLTNVLKRVHNSTGTTVDEKKDKSTGTTESK